MKSCINRLLQVLTTVWFLVILLHPNDLVADEDELLLRLLNLEEQMLISSKSAPFVQNPRDILFFQCLTGLQPGGVTPSGEQGVSWWANKPFYGDGSAYAASRSVLLKQFGARAEENFVVVPNNIPMNHLALGVVKSTKKGVRFLPLEMGDQANIILSSEPYDFRNSNFPNRRGFVDFGVMLGRSGTNIARGTGRNMLTGAVLPDGAEYTPGAALAARAAVHYLWTQAAGTFSSAFSSASSTFAGATGGLSLGGTLGAVGIGGGVVIGGAGGTALTIRHRYQVYHSAHEAERLLAAGSGLPSNINPDVFKLLRPEIIGLMSKYNEDPDNISLYEYKMINAPRRPNILWQIGN